MDICRLRLKRDKEVAVSSNSASAAGSRPPVFQETTPAIAARTPNDAESGKKCVERNELTVQKFIQPKIYTNLFHCRPERGEEGRAG
jgi:hypothetical protein